MEQSGKERKKSKGGKAMRKIREVEDSDRSCVWAKWMFGVLATSNNLVLKQDRGGGSLAQKEEWSVVLWAWPGLWYFYCAVCLLGPVA